MPYRLNGKRIYKVKGSKSKTGRKTFKTKAAAKKKLKRRGKRR